MHAGPLLLHYFMATTITIATTTNNDIDQHEPAEMGAECQVSDHSSIGKRRSEGVGGDTSGGCPYTRWVRGMGHLWWMPMHLLSVWDGAPTADAHAPVGLELASSPTTEGSKNL